MPPPDVVLKGGEQNRRQSLPGSPKIVRSVGSKSFEPPSPRSDSAPLEAPKNDMGAALFQSVAPSKAAPPPSTQQAVTVTPTKATPPPQQKTKSPKSKGGAKAGAAPGQKTPQGGQTRSAVAAPQASAGSAGKGAQAWGAKALQRLQESVATGNGKAFLEAWPRESLQQEVFAAMPADAAGVMLDGAVAMIPTLLYRDADLVGVRLYSLGKKSALMPPARRRALAASLRLSANTGPQSAVGARNAPQQQQQQAQQPKQQPQQQNVQAQGSLARRASKSAQPAQGAKQKHAKADTPHNTPTKPGQSPSKKKLLREREERLKEQAFGPPIELFGMAPLLTDAAMGHLSDMAVTGGISGEMYSKVAASLISADDGESRLQLVSDVERVLRQAFPEANLRVYAFGGTKNSFGMKGEPLDMALIDPEAAGLNGAAKVARVKRMCRALEQSGTPQFTRVRPGDTDALSTIDGRALDYEVHIVANVQGPLFATQMVRSYGLVDDRVRVVGCCVTLWARSRGLSGVARGMLSEFAWLLMVVNYLQRETPRVLPTLSLPVECFTPEEMRVAGHEASYGRVDKTVLQFRETQAMAGGAVKTVGELLFGFFADLGFVLNPALDVVSIASGAVVSLSQTQFAGGPSPAWRLAIEDPFDKAVDHSSALVSRANMLRIIEEARKSAALLASPECTLSQVCE